MSKLLLFLYMNLICLLPRDPSETDETSTYSRFLGV